MSVDPKPIAEWEDPLPSQFSEIECEVISSPETPHVSKVVLRNCKPATTALIRRALTSVQKCVRFTHFEFCRVPKYVNSDTVMQFLSRVQLRFDPARLEQLDPNAMHPLSDLGEHNSLVFSAFVSAPAEPSAEISLREPSQREHKGPLLLASDIQAQAEKFDAAAIKMLGEQHWTRGLRPEPHSLVSDITPLPAIRAKLRTVTLGDLEWVPIGGQRERLGVKGSPSILEKDTPLVQLLPGESFEVRAYATVDVALPKANLEMRECAQVTQVTHHDLFSLKLGPKVNEPGVPLALRMACASRTGNAFLEQVFGLDGKTSIAREWACTGCKKCDEVVDIERVPDAAVLTLVTSGKYQAAAVFQRTMRFLLEEHSRRKRGRIEIKQEE